MTSFGTGASILASLDFAPAAEGASAEETVLEVFDEMRTPVLQYLLWMNLNPDQAEDVLQETFLRLYLQLTREQLPTHNVRGWVWKVTHNLGVNLRRALNRKQNGKEVALDDLSVQLVDPHPNPEQCLEQRETEREMQASIERLSERERQCVHLRAQGLKYRQIASILGIGRSTVADTLERAAKLLRSHAHS